MQPDGRCPPPVLRVPSSVGEDLPCRRRLRGCLFHPFSLQKHSFFAQHTCFAYVKKGSVAEISPDLLPDAAARRWQTAILRCPELLVELAAEELSFDCRHLPAQREVRLIRRYLC